MRPIAPCARVSNNEPTERGTIVDQLACLRGCAALEGSDVAHEYTDEGVSGVLVLEERSVGRRRREDARRRRYSLVLVDRFGSFGRSVSSVTVCYDPLDDAVASIRSSSWGTDTRTAVGR
jgi:hypothetical protein